MSGTVVSVTTSKESLISPIDSFYWDRLGQSDNWKVVFTNEHFVYETNRFPGIE